MVTQSSLGLILLYSTPVDQILRRPFLDTWIDRSDDFKGSNETCSLRRQKILFVGHMGDIRLVGSLFKILGTPNLATSVIVCFAQTLCLKKRKETEILILIIRLSSLFSIRNPKIYQTFLK